MSEDIVNMWGYPVLKLMTPNTHGIKEGSNEDQPDEVKVKEREKKRKRTRQRR